VADVVFTDPAIDDLRRIGPDAVPKVLKKILLLLENSEAGYPLGGELTGFRKLVVGRNTWRIVYRITDDKTVEICEIWAVGERADAEVYAEAQARVRAAGGSRPDVVRLGEVIDRLGAFTDHIRIDEVPARACARLAGESIDLHSRRGSGGCGGTRPGRSGRSMGGVPLEVSLAFVGLHS
jgi:mRNA interferase RelE/StbE